MYGEIRGRAQATQGGLTIYGMCEWARVSRASFYRHWEGAAPSEAEMALRQAVQQAALSHRFYGYRRVLEVVRREGYEVGGKRVRRLLRCLLYTSQGAWRGPDEPCGGGWTAASSRCSSRTGVTRGWRSSMWASSAPL